MELLFFYTETVTNPARARVVFREMRECGATGVFINIYEQDLLRWKKDLPRLFDEAGAAGLKRYVSYGRYGGAFSGALMVPSLFTFLRPDTVVVPENPKAATGGEADVAASEFFTRISCVNHPAFRKYMENQTQIILTQLKPDGLLFDEPKGLGLVCQCPHCRQGRRNGEVPAEANRRFQAEFVRALADQVKAYRADACTMLVVGHNDEEVLRQFATIGSLDVLGAEAYWVNRGKPVSWLREWCPATVRQLRQLGKRTQLWTGNFGLPAHEEENLREAYRAMAAAQPDQLASFWWWRGSDNPERVMELTREALHALR